VAEPVCFGHPETEPEDYWPLSPASRGVRSAPRKVLRRRMVRVWERWIAQLPAIHRITGMRPLASVTLPITVSRGAGWCLPGSPAGASGRPCLKIFVQPNART